MRLNFTVDMTWGRLILLKETTKKLISRHKGCRQMVIEPLHCGSSSILKVRFFGTPCMYLYVFVICLFVIVFVYILACNIYYLAQLVPIFLAHAGGPSVSAIIIDTTATVVMLRAISV